MSFKRHFSPREVKKQLNCVPIENLPTTEEVCQALKAILGPDMSGFTLRQVNGQRKLFYPILEGNFTPPDGSEVFVGNLPRNLFEDELLPLFLAMGPVLEMRMMMNFSNTNRGFAFVKFFDCTSARRAVKQLDDFQIRRGQRIGVVLSIDNRQLVITGLHDRTPSIDWFYGLTEGIENVELELYQGHGINAILTFHTHRAAAMARRYLIPSKNELFAAFGPYVAINWADPRLEAQRRH